jgi:hypothetical protein
MNALKDYLRNLHHIYHYQDPFDVGIFDNIIDTVAMYASRAIAARENYTTDLYLCDFEITDANSYNKFTEETSPTKEIENDPHSLLNVNSNNILSEDSIPSVEDVRSFNFPPIELPGDDVNIDDTVNVSTKAMGSLFGINSQKFISYLIKNYKISDVDSVISNLFPAATAHDKRIFNFKFCEYIMQNYEGIQSAQSTHFKGLALDIAITDQ